MHYALFRRILFCYLVGIPHIDGEQFSTITIDGVSSLAPAYNLWNPNIYIRQPHNGFNLPINGKKDHLLPEDIFHYLAAALLKIQPKAIQRLIIEFKSYRGKMEKQIYQSLLSHELRRNYLFLLDERYRIL